jgi:glycosyltransferase involved in cell wall biosynthesis
MLIYKLFNKNAVVYIKMDLSIQNLESQASQPFRQFVRNQIFDRFFLADIYTVETKICFDRLRSLRPRLAQRLHLFPNGIDFAWLEAQGFLHSKVTDKENILITVARIGTWQKNNEMMLEALNGLHLNGWKFLFIGPVEENFLPKIDGFYLANPEKRDSVVFMGSIDDKNELYGHYQKAKVFCLTI